MSDSVSLQRASQEWRARMEMWIRDGAAPGWLFDPSRKAVEVYRPGKPVEVREGQPAVYGEGTVGGFVLDLG